MIYIVIMLLALSSPVLAGGHDRDCFSECIDRIRGNTKVDVDVEQIMDLAHRLFVVDTGDASEEGWRGSKERNRYKRLAWVAIVHQARMRRR